VFSKAIEKAILLSNEIGCVGLIVHTYNKSLIDGFYKKYKIDCDILFFVFSNIRLLSL